MSIKIFISPPKKSTEGGHNNQTESLILRYTCVFGFYPVIVNT